MLDTGLPGPWSSILKKKKKVGTTVGMSALRPPPRSLSFQVCTSALREFTRRGCRYHCRYVRTAAASPLSLLPGLHICTLGVHKARCGEQFQANSMCNLQIIFTPLHCLLLICGNLASDAADSAASPIPKEVHAAHLVNTSCPTYAKGARRCRVHGRVPRNKTQDAMHPNVSA